MESYCVRAFAEGLEIIPYTLAENAGLNPIEIVTELRNHHANGRRHHGGPAGLGLDAGCAGSYGQQHMMCL
jgi:T-complex protein 1 subunit delta